MGDDDHPFALEYAPDVEGDFEEIGRVAARRVLGKIQDTLPKAPNQYGEGLDPPLQKYRRLRAGQYRVIYLVRDDLTPQQVWVLAVGKRAEGDREDIYERTSLSTLRQRIRNLLERLAGR